MSVLRKVSAGLAWGQAGRITEVGLALAFSVLIVRRLGDYGYGSYALLFSVIGLTSLLSSFGFQEAMSKYVPAAEAAGATGAVSRMLREFLVRRMLVTILASAGLYSASGFLANLLGSPAISDYAILMVCVFAVQSVADLIAAFYISSLRIKTYYLVRLIAQSLSLALTAIFFAIWGPAVPLVLAAVLSSTAASVVCYAIGVRGELQAAAPEAKVGGAYRFGLTIWLINLLTFGLGNQVDTLLIGYFIKDEAQIAYYSVAAMVLSRVYLALTGWTVALLPSMSELLTKKGKDVLADACNLYFRLHLAVLLPVMAFVGFRSGPLVNMVFGPDFERSAGLLSTYAALTVGAVFFFSGPALNAVYVAGGAKIALWLRVFYGGLNVVLDILLIPTFGALGAVIATGLSVVLSSLSELIIAHRLTSARYPFEFAIKLSLATGLAILAASSISASTWPMLLVSGLTYAAVLGVSLYLLKPLTAKDRELAGYASQRLGYVARYF